MTERPILFSAPMVRAIMDGSKSQTRRIVKPQPEGEPRPLSEWSRGLAAACHDHSPNEEKLDAHSARLNGRVFPFTTKSGGLASPRCPYGAPSDHLWVRETFQLCPQCGALNYKAFGSKNCHACDMSLGKWHPSIHIFRDWSRITLEIIDVRVERLQDINPDDAIAEGLKGITKDGKLVKYGIPDSDGYPGTDNTGWPWEEWRISPVDAYRKLWETINGKGSWDANPYVWIISFRRIK